MILKESNQGMIINEIKAPKQFESKMVGQISLKKGQKIFTYDPDSNKVKELIMDQSTLERASYQHNAGMYDREGRLFPNMADTIHHKSYWNPSLLHVIAINEYNARRKFIKLIEDYERETMRTTSAARP